MSASSRAKWAVSTNQRPRSDRSSRSTPDFVFGHYNLGHTLFLAASYAEALAAYEEGQRRDPQKNRRQACRLAMSRFASRRCRGAGRDLWRFAEPRRADEREDLLLEAYEIALALADARIPAAADRSRRFLDRLAAEITKSE